MKSPLTSPRMVKLMTALENAGAKGLTPLEINEQCQTTRASSDVSEARQNGVEIQVDFAGTSPSGRKVFRYSLAKFALQTINQTQP